MRDVQRCVLLTDKILCKRTTSKLGEMAFSIAGPAAWNLLPVDIRQVLTTFDTFKWKLTTFLFLSSKSNILCTSSLQASFLLIRRYINCPHHINIIWRANLRLKESIIAIKWHFKTIWSNFWLAVSAKIYHICYRFNVICAHFKGTPCRTSTLHRNIKPVTQKNTLNSSKRYRPDLGRTKAGLRPDLGRT